MVTQERIIRVSKAVQCLRTIRHNVDTALGIPPVNATPQHQSLVFDYVPGRYHYSIPNMQPCNAKSINSNKLIETIMNQKKHLKSDFKFSYYLQLAIYKQYFIVDNNLHSKLDNLCTISCTTFSCVFVTLC